MQFEVTNTNVRSIVGRLRNAIGIDKLTASQAYEVLAKTLGVKNWDTLSGQLGKESTQAQTSFKLAAPIELYVDAFSCDAFGEGPAWASVTLTQEFVQELLRMQDLCENNHLSQVSKHYHADNWDRADDLNIQGDTLEVGSTSWWFRAQPKHTDYHVETRLMNIKDMMAVLAGGTDQYLAFRKDKLIYDAAGNIQGLVEMLVDAGELDESYLEA